MRENWHQRGNGLIYDWMDWLLIHINISIIKKKKNLQMLQNVTIMNNLKIFFKEETTNAGNKAKPDKIYTF